MTNDTPNPGEGREAPLTAAHRMTLMRTAYESVEHGVEFGRPLAIPEDEGDPRLLEPAATFVTLRSMPDGGLIGCIGSLEPRQPLIVDVARNAFAAAFEDPRSPGVSRSMLSQLDIHISILSPLTPIEFDSQEDLLRLIRPDIDGLVLQDGPYRGTFLPAVWETLPDPRQFLDQLKVKAGLHRTHWSNNVRVWRYTAEVIP